MAVSLAAFFMGMAIMALLTSSQFPKDIKVTIAGGLILWVITMCAIRYYGEPKTWIPPHVVLVDGVSHDVEVRRWCEPEKACELMSRQDVYWQVEPDGQVKAMHNGEELRFERGIFSRPLEGDPYWTATDGGEYLLATTDARQALIIHYPK